MKNLKKYCLLLGILPLAFMGLAVNFSQPAKPEPSDVKETSPFGIVSGTVTDARTKEPMPYVHITLFQAGKTITSTFSDLNGHYNLQYLKPAHYDLLFEYIMYEDIHTQVDAVADSTTIMNITMSEMDCHKHYTDPPACPHGNHTNKILPIVYGKPDAVTKSGKVYYGGEKFKCEEYYCKKHKKAF